MSETIEICLEIKEAQIIDPRVVFVNNRAYYPEQVIYESSLWNVNRPQFRKVYRLLKAVMPQLNEGEYGTLISEEGKKILDAFRIMSLTLGEKKALDEVRWGRFNPDEWLAYSPNLLDRVRNFSKRQNRG
ncbi:hypothetical protein [Planktothrix sp. FACHB-1365]|uniref:hypothetical protein n=1 Tax=Planktothrix sp. FACHB-1365 TaxID=2692855 RepID=UPI001689FBBF|nr:hypothetical protein [Planktothrix sp. FACHB-1365]MBD2483974.1 hypothetical protein [Planktothrix sp. FACHB-1365]